MLAEEIASKRRELLELAACHDRRADYFGTGPRARRPGSQTRGQLATRTLATSAMTSPGSDDGWAWTSPEICPPHSISIWP
jgi:hypothetical protein